jgi:DNA repair photolyase
MIYPYVGDFLISPIPLQLSFNYCSHKCSYCFANLNNPNRSFDLKEFQNQLRGIYTNNNLQSALLREKYPVLISNLVDPFATSNYNISVPVIEQLTAMGIPVALQTRGGRGVDDVLNFLPKTVWYISIPMLNDEIRKRVEPGAPSIESRLDLIDKLIAKGHPVLVGINPTIEDFLPSDDSFKLIDILTSKGVHGVWVAAMHFNRKQLEVMPAKDKERLGAVIEKGKKNATKLQDSCYQFIDRLRGYAMQKGLWVEGMFDGELNKFFNPFFETYDKVFPTVHEFINWCHENKKAFEPVYYHEFESVLLPRLPKGLNNVSPYWTCMNRNLDTELRESIGYKQSYKKMLEICWNEDRMKRQLTRYWSFAYGFTNDSRGLQWRTDEQGNLVYHFHPGGFEDNFYIAE